MADAQDHDNEDSSCNSSCNSSCCDYESEDSIPEWNDAVQENGELFFVKCSPLIQDLSLNDEPNVKPVVIRSKYSKFSKLLKKHKSKKQQQGASVTKTPSVEKQASVAKPECDKNFEDITENSAAVLYLNLISSERESANENVLYCFPYTTEKNIMYLIRGALLTLYHLLPKLVSEVPRSSTLLVNGRLLHLVYMGNENELLVIALPDNRCSLFELQQLGISVTRYLNFRYRSLHECFSNLAHHASLNQFFGNLFIKFLKSSISESCPTVNISSEFVKHEGAQFENCFIFPCIMTLPNNLQMKIEEKLNEIEANDFGDVSEDRYGYQRLFTIIGTCLYHKGYLVTTHLNIEDQLDVHSYLRLNEMLDLTVTSLIDSLVIWQEVFLSSCAYTNTEGTRSFSTNKRWFLLIIGQDQSLLVTLLEAGGCSFRTAGISKPNELYVEQIQDILTDILHFRLADAVEQMTRTPRSPTPQKQASARSTENLLSTGRDAERNSLWSGTLAKSTSSLSCESDHVLYHSSPRTFNGCYDDTFSDTLSRAPSSVFSDEVVPVLGRRAQRLKQLSNSGSIYPLYSNHSDSDRSDLDATSSSLSNIFVENKQKISKVLNPVKKIIHGAEKALYHYVNLYSNKGVMLCSLNTHVFSSSAKYKSIISNFRLTAQKIHNVLSQKKISSIGRYQKNCISVKEYGVLFEYANEAEEKKTTSITYWVVGRKFNKPYAGEVYVCYEDETPQNFVEIAFRLATFA